MDSIKTTAKNCQLVCRPISFSEAIVDVKFMLFNQFLYLHYDASYSHGILHSFMMHLVMSRESISLVDNLYPFESHRFSPNNKIVASASYLFLLPKG